jgi:hypothetical protein
MPAPGRSCSDGSTTPLRLVSRKSDIRDLTSSPGEQLPELITKAVCDGSNLSLGSFSC